MLYTTKDKVDRNNDKFGGYTFKFGGNIEDIQLWDRYRIGYPISAVTIDHNVKSKITQGRIHIDCIVINLAIGFVLILVFNIILKILKSIKKVFDDSRIFQKDKH